MQILLIEHDEVDELFPFSEIHCSWELRCGLYTILERWVHSVPTSNVTIASHRDLHIRSFVERHPLTVPFLQEPTLIMSGHVLLSPVVMNQMVDACSDSLQPILFFCNGHAVGVFVNTPLQSPDAAGSLLRNIDVESCRTIEISGHTISRLWQAIDHIGDAIRWDSNFLQVNISPDADIHPTVVIDESAGPVVVVEGASVNAFSVLSGPVVIGKDATVKPHSHIGYSVIGPVCKVAGEVEHSIMHGYSNKQHLGFLGHSYLCEWVNFGAGTITSDLKSTYGHISVSLPWGEEDSQRIFVGILVGDHTKTASGTIFTPGTICGVSCSIAVRSFPPKYVPSFSWMAQTDSRKYEIEKAIDVARIVMARRLTDLGPATEALLREKQANSEA